MTGFMLNRTNQLRANATRVAGLVTLSLLCAPLLAGPLDTPGNTLLLHTQLPVQAEYAAGALDAHGNAWISLQAASGAASFELLPNGTIAAARFETAPNVSGPGSITPLDVPGVIGRADRAGFVIQRKLRSRAASSVWLESDAPGELGGTLPLSGDRRSAVAADSFSYLSASRTPASGAGAVQLSLRQGGDSWPLQSLVAEPVDLALASNPQHLYAWTSTVAVPGSRPQSYVHTVGLVDATGQVAWSEQQSLLSWSPQQLALDGQGNLLQMDSDASNAISQVQIYDRAGVLRYQLEAADLAGVERILEGVWTGNKLWLMLGGSEGEARALRSLDGQGRLSPRLPIAVLDGATMVASASAGVVIAGSSVSRDDVLTLASYDSAGRRLWQRDLTGWQQAHRLLGNTAGDLRLVARTAHGDNAVAEIDPSHGGERWRSLLNRAEAAYAPVETRRAADALWIGGVRQSVGSSGLSQVWQRVESGPQGVQATRELQFAGRSADAVAIDAGIVAVAISADRLVVHALGANGVALERDLASADDSVRQLRLQAVNQGEVALVMVAGADQPLRYWRLRAEDLTVQDQIDLNLPSGQLQDALAAFDGSIYALTAAGNLVHWDEHGQLMTQRPLPSPGTGAAWFALQPSPVDGVLVRGVGVRTGSFAAGDPCRFPESLVAIGGDLRPRWSIAGELGFAALNLVQGSDNVGVSGADCRNVAGSGGWRYAVTRADDGTLLASTNLVAGDASSGALLVSDAAELWFLRDGVNGRTLIRRQMGAGESVYAFSVAPPQIATRVLAADTRQAWLSAESPIATLALRADRQLLRVQVP